MSTWGNYPKRVKNEGFLNATLKQEQPKMSDEETALLTEQTNSLRAQQKVTANQFHYDIGTDGTWRKMSDQEWYGKQGDTEKKQWDLYQKELGRYDKALEGALPLSQGMQAAKADEFQGFKNTSGVTGSNMDTAKVTDTIGVQRLDAMKKRWNLIQEQENQTALGQSGNMVVQGQQLTGFGTGNVQNIGNTNAWSTVMNPYTQYNIAGYQAGAQDRANTIGLVGTVAGMMSKKGGS
jgi:hypothetical protein